MQDGTLERIRSRVIIALIAALGTCVLSRLHTLHAPKHACEDSLPLARLLDPLSPDFWVFLGGEEVYQILLFTNTHALT